MSNGIDPGLFDPAYIQAQNDARLAPARSLLVQSPSPPANTSRRPFFLWAMIVAGSVSITIRRIYFWAMVASIIATSSFAGYACFQPTNGIIVITEFGILISMSLLVLWVASLIGSFVARVIKRDLQHL